MWGNKCKALTPEKARVTDSFVTVRLCFVHVKKSAFAVLWIVSSCTSFGETTLPGGAGSAPDGGVAPQPPDIPASPLLDAGSEVDAGPCRVMIGGNLATEAARWSTLGGARVEAEKFVLTSGEGEQTAGAAWWKAELTLEASLRVTAEFTSTTAPSHVLGEGLTVAWVDAKNGARLGSQGQSFGLCTGGMTGYAVAEDTRDRQLLVLDAVGCDYPARPTITVEGAHVLALVITKNEMSGTFDGQSFSRVIDGGELAIPTNGYFGFTAATPKNGTAHLVTSLKVESCR